MKKLITRINGKCRRTLANRFCRRMVNISGPLPMISFTFDDAPKSAFTVGSAILGAHGAKATYYVSLGLLGLETEVGTIATQEDLSLAVQQGHELGCHTFDHLDAWYTSTGNYMNSVIKNKDTLDKILPGEHFTTFAYPKNGAKLSVKYPIQKRFVCSRGGGQVANIGLTDLNHLKACFLDKRANVDIEYIKKLIDYNKAHRGWLIFATHDVSDDPSPYGCTPKFLREVVEYSVLSGAALLSVRDAYRQITASVS